MFSLERTTQSLLSQSNSTSISQDIVLSQFGASSQFYQPRQTGYLRGTQKFDWSQTQSASQRINGNDDNDIADLSTRASNSATRRNVFAPTQFLTSNLPSFLKSINGEFSGDFVSSIAIIVPTQNSQAHNGIISNPRTSSQTILSQRGNNAKLMPPPVGLPTQFFSKALISQRLPHRFQSSSSNSNSDDSSYLKGTTQKYYSSRLRSAQQKRQQQSKQQNRVNVYRKYRTGELPDICISHLDIIRPLQALCLKDSKLASILFNSLFEAMYGSVRDENGSYDTESINLKLRESLFMMFCGGDNSDASTLLRVSDRQLISCLLLCSRHCLALEADLVTQNSMNSKKVKSKPLDFNDIPRSKRMALEPDYNHKESFSEDKLNMFVLSELSPSLVATLSLQSMNYHSGILFLEEQIMVRDLRLTEVKNSGQRSSHSDKHLHHLCSLYEALGDKDTLVGLYVKLSSFEETSRALDAELAGNFHEAIEVYNDLIMKHRLSTLSRRSSESSNNCGGSPPILSGDAIAIFPSEDEVELWDDRSLQCLQQLLDWGQLDEKLNMIAEAHYFEPMITGSFEPSTWESFLLNPSAVLADKKKKYIPLKLNCLINIEESEDYLRLFLERLLIAPRNSPEEKLRQYIEKAHPVELATCFGVVGDWNKVKCNVIICYDQFLNTWPVLHRNATKARNALLLQLQTVSELEDSALFKLDKLSVEDGNSTFKSGFDKSLAKRKLLSRWSNSLPSIGDSVNAWNSVIKVRHLLLDSEGGIDAASHLSKMHIKFARAAVYQRSVRVVKGQITIGGKYRRAAQTDTAAKDCVTLDEVLAVHAYNQLTIDALTKTNHYSADLDKILSIFDKTRGLLDRKIGQIAEECSKIDSMGNYHNTDYTKLSIMRANWMCAKWSVLGNKNSGEGIRVATEAFDMLQEIARGISNRSSSASVEQLKQLLGYQHITLLGTTYERLAHHCNLLRQQGTMELTSAASDVVGVCIDSYLKGLQLGDLACRDRVVSIIQLVSSHYPSNLIPDRIISAIRKVPSWMFLRHAAQLMGYFDRPEGPIATVVLEQVAEKYPAALHYHFKIASERLGAQGINLVRCLSRKLANHSVDCFVEALDGLTHPDLRLTDALKEVVLYHRNVVGSITDAMIREAAKSLNDKNSVQNLPYVTLCKMINKCKDDSTILSWPHVQGKIGNYNRSFAKEIKKFFDANLPKLSGSPELFKLSDTTISSLFAKARETISKAYDGGKVLLSEFSHWLAEFDFDLHNVEIPGQYICSGFSCEPDVSKHSLIMGFDPQLLVMSSIRRPKRLTIYGESGIFKQFLVKGGEDLRNDDRIEQLFSLMNSIISQSSGVRLTQTLDGMDDDMMSKSAFALVGNDQNLAARTFGVVPMTSKLGILEWCQGTIPFKAVMQAELAKDKYFVSTNPSAVVKLPQSNRGRPSTLNISLSGDEIIIAGSEASKIRQKWLTDEGGYVGTIKKMSLSGSGNSNPRSCVLAEGMITSLWQQMISTIPNDLLRRFLLSKATSPEAFYAFRANFTRTIAIASIYGYVLGIGDRHLDNLLIDKLTGDVVMIDFGICFGMGASQLPVPELIPFRLTPQITNVSRPLDGVSHLRNYMLKALTAIRNKDGVERLKNDLEVYINDPLVDWIKGSGVQKEEIEALREKLTWEPRRRIDAVVKKIKGVNPITILLNDLSINASVKKNNIIDGYCNLLGLIDGSAVACFRQETAQASNPKNVPKKRMRTVEDVGHPELSDGEVVIGLLTPPEQIDILLKLGTSPEILCRQYEGLVTWM